MRLVNADEILRYMEDKEISQYVYEMNAGNDKYSSTPLYDYVKAMPTAYDVDKVVEELDKLQTYNMGLATLMCDIQRNGINRHYICLEEAIEIVKQGGVIKDVELMKATGFVRRFDDLGRINIPKEIRIKLFGTRYTDGQPMEIFMDKDNVILRKFEESISDDVCEWKYTREIMDNAEFKVGCNPNALKRGIVPNNFSYCNFKYCPYCGKKIKVVDKNDD